MTVLWIAAAALVAASALPVALLLRRAQREATGAAGALRSLGATIGQDADRLADDSRRLRARFDELREHLP